MSRPHREQARSHRGSVACQSSGISGALAGLPDLPFLAGLVPLAIFDRFGCNGGCYRRRGGFFLRGWQGVNGRRKSSSNRPTLIPPPISSFFSPSLPIRITLVYAPAPEFQRTDQCHGVLRTKILAFELPEHVEHGVHPIFRWAIPSLLAGSSSDFFRPPRSGRPCWVQ